MLKNYIKLLLCTTILCFNIVVTMDNHSQEQNAEAVLTILKPEIISGLENRINCLGQRKCNMSSINLVQNCDALILKAQSRLEIWKNITMDDLKNDKIIIDINSFFEIKYFLNQNLKEFFLKNKQVKISNFLLYIVNQNFTCLSQQKYVKTLFKKHQKRAELIEEAIAYEIQKAYFEKRAKWFNYFFGIGYFFDKKITVNEPKITNCSMETVCFLINYIKTILFERSISLSQWDDTIQTLEKLQSDFFADILSVFKDIDPHDDLIKMIVSFENNNPSYNLMHLLEEMKKRVDKFNDKQIKEDFASIIQHVKVIDDTLNVRKNLDQLNNAIWKQTIQLYGIGIVTSLLLILCMHYVMNKY